MLFVILGTSIIICLLIIYIYNPGKLSQLKNSKGEIIQGSIAKKVFVNINGIKQGMFLRGENIQNPIILYLHGGPGTPLFQFISYLEKEDRIEKYFTVCYWDQRGSGMTFDKATDVTTMTLEQMIEDTHAVTEYLKSRFHQDKIYLLGHSWGSYLGVKTIEKYPDNYLAYIGIGQVTNQKESERLAYHYMLERAIKTNDKKVIKKLKKYDPFTKEFPHLDYLVQGRTSILNKYGIGHLHQGVNTLQILFSLFVFKGYTLSEKIKWLKGADYSMVHLFPPLLIDDLFQSAIDFRVPIYVLQGKYDYMTSQVLAQRYIEAIHAPEKAFYMFENSAHSPNMEEPAKFIQIFRKIASENTEKISESSES